MSDEIIDSISTRMDVDMIDKIDEMVTRLGKDLTGGGRSEVIRMAIAEYIKSFRERHGGGNGGLTDRDINLGAGKATAISRARRTRPASVPFRFTKVERMLRHRAKGETNKAF